MKLMRIGEWRDAETGEQLAAQGDMLGGLKLLFNGEVVVERDGAEVGRARDGAMIGEISFIQGGAATATVVATKPCRYVAWSGEELQKLLHRNPGMDIAMKHVFSLDMMRKLTI
jgi:CRP-like cAMP-binding protein